MAIRLNEAEMSAMSNLPFMHRCLYIFGIRQYMDYETGITGIKRGISWQSLREELYVEHHQGRIEYGSPSREQVRRAAEMLEKKGVILNISEGLRLIFKCILAIQDKSVQNKPDRRPTYQPDIEPDTLKSNKNKDNNNKPDIEPDREQHEKHDTPLVSGIYKSNKLDLYYFDQFWTIYPRKINKKKAKDVWIKNNLDLVINKILDDITERKKGDVNWIEGNQYVPHPTTYLNQERWTDEEKYPKPQLSNNQQGNNHAEDKQSLKQRRKTISRRLEEDYINSLNSD